MALGSRRSLSKRARFEYHSQRNQSSGPTRAVRAVGGLYAACRSDDRRCRGRAECLYGFSLLCAAGPAGRGGARCLGWSTNCRRCRAPSPAAQTCRDPAAGTFASGPLEIRPLAVERAAICLGAGALCPAPVPDRQLDPRLLAARARRLDVGGRAMDFVTDLPLLSPCGPTASKSSRALS
jgi:hypothetical protein